MPPPQVARPAPVVPRNDVDIVNRGADNFLRLFYAAYDSAQRLETLPKFYRENSTINWNGTTITGLADLQQFLAKMPVSKHEVQSYNCHAIPGTEAKGAPTLVITVSGQVTHGPPDNPEKRLRTNERNFPRVFGQTFMLQPEAPNATETKYFVLADSMRFVG